MFAFIDSVLLKISFVPELVGTALMFPFSINNEITFLLQSVCISLFAIGALKLGKEALVAFMGACWILGNLFVTKQATFFGLNAITSDAFAVGASLSITLLQEYYGSHVAHKAIKIGLYIAFFFAVVSQIHVAYVPNCYDWTHLHFEPLLATIPRIVFTSFFVGMISQSLNLFLFEKFTQLLGDRLFGVRLFCALALSQIADTTLFACIALYGTVHSLAHVIFFSSIIKCISIALCVPLVQFCRTYIKKTD